MIEQGAMHPDIEQVLFTEEDIAAMVKRRDLPRLPG